MNIRLTHSWTDPCDKWLKLRTIRSAAPLGLHQETLSQLITLVLEETLSPWQTFFFFFCLSFFFCLCRYVTNVAMGVQAVSRSALIDIDPAGQHHLCLKERKKCSNYCQ